jgi:hypothetical protein
MHGTHDLFLAFGNDPSLTAFTQANVKLLQFTILLLPDAADGKNIKPWLLKGACIRYDP